MQSVFSFYYMFAIKLVIAMAGTLVFLKFFSMKNQLKQMTPLDVIINFILSAILSRYILDEDINFVQFLGIMVIYGGAMYLISRFIYDSRLGRDIFVGQPKIIIRHGECNMDMMKKMKISAMDIAAVLRQQKIHSISDVEMAQIEPSGELTVVKKGEENYSIVIIDNGAVVEDGLKRIKKSKSWLNQQLHKQGIKNIADVFIAQWGPKGLDIVKLR